MNQLRLDELEIQANKQELLIKESNLKVEDQLDKIKRGSDIDITEAETTKKEVEEQIKKAEEAIEKGIEPSEIKFQ